MVLLLFWKLHNFEGNINQRPFKKLNSMLVNFLVKLCQGTYILLFLHSTLHIQHFILSRANFLRTAPHITESTEAHSTQQQSISHSSGSFSTVYEEGTTFSIVRGWAQKHSRLLIRMKYVLAKQGRANLLPSGFSSTRHQVQRRDTAQESRDHILHSTSSYSVT